MGACISIHHKASSMKGQAPFDPDIKPDHTSVIHPSPTSGSRKLVSTMDEDHVDVKPDRTWVIDHSSPTSGAGDEEHVAVKPQVHSSTSPATFSEYGSREEAFFDSQAWLDSDYEDEFMSVKGEFTPSSSRGSTPGHHSLTQGTPRVNVGATFTNHIEPLGSTSQPSPTPTEKRRRLLDLFKDSLRDNNNLDSSFEIGEPSNKDGQMGSEKDGPKPKGESHVGSMSGCFKSLISVRTTGKQKSPTRTLV